jgi:hypothetical protein
VKVSSHISRNIHDFELKRLGDDNEE